VKILFLCHRVPYPPWLGSKVRSFNMIRHLSKDHEVHVVSLARSAAEGLAGDGLRAYCRFSAVVAVNELTQVARMIAHLPTPVSSTTGYFRARSVVRLVKEKLDDTRFDLVIVHSSGMAQYVERLPAPRKLLDFCDMDSQKWLEYAKHKPVPLSLGYRLEGNKLAREERRMARRFDVCTVATPAELATLTGYDTGAAVDWFPQGVDVDYFAPGPESYESDIITFVGRMDYFPNEQCMMRFCERSLPLIRARRPNLRLQIVGADPSRSVRRLGRLPGVIVTGSVPDVRPYLARSALAVAPLEIARGTQNKILEAMAAGVPVIASRRAAQGVDATEGEHLLACETAQEYAAAIERVLSDPDERRRLSRAGRDRVLRRHRWEDSMRRLDGIIERCMSNGGRKAISSNDSAASMRQSVVRDTDCSADVPNTMPSHWN
jgi:sugar transferase (PEP-CTERM/EpsH1 system associated)